MRSVPAAFCVAAFTFASIPLTLAGQPATDPAARSKPAPPPPAATTPPLGRTSPLDLPVRKVVLYKNGVGYFEHAGSLNGNQRVAIDFTSQQLNDVLQSLTVLDEGGGRIAGVNYNSTTPIGQQLDTLALGLKDYPATIAVYHALRGQRVEVTGAGAAIAGRLVNVEFRKETDKNGVTSEDHYFLIVATDSGALRTTELTDSVSVRMLDASLQKQFSDYLEIVASAQNQQVRHLTLDDRGRGQRQLRVSYISEIPVWKSTYRIVFPREANGNATVQGWAVVDNTVGADWDNVQLSLVAGAPQSFIQPLSQQIYTRRPEIPIATSQQTTPQTHEAPQAAPPPVTSGPVPAGQPNFMAGAMKRKSNSNAEFGQATQTVEVNGQNATDLAVISGAAGGMISGSGAGYGYGVGGGVYRASDAIAEGDVSTNAFDDFFEYALTQPVTIHKNESAMVPILQQELPVEHVTLWSERENSPLRAVWLDNKSKLTLDSGSFSIFESGEFAGEGLLDPIHPGERRLLSYAADQAVKVKVADRANNQRLHHLAINKGSIVETYMNVAGITYSANNTGDVDRTVLIEHLRHSGTRGWSLDGDLKAAEETPNLYRFRLQVPAHSTAKLEVREHGPEYTSVNLDSDPHQEQFLIELIKQVPGALAQIQPVIDAETALTTLDEKIADLKKAEETAAADEARDRDNLTALKGNDAARRFVDELNRAEDQLQATRKQISDLEQQKANATAKLYQLIGALSFDWDEAAK
jgi:hypothetical protein